MNYASASLLLSEAQNSAGLLALDTIFFCDAPFTVLPVQLGPLLEEKLRLELKCKVHTASGMGLR